MYRYVHLVLALVPAVLGCTNPDSNSCASFMKNNPATASAFCASFTAAASPITATAGLPSWASNCSNKPKEISKECSCYYTGGPAPTQATTTRTTLTTSVTQTSTTTSAQDPGPTGGDCSAAPVNQLVGYGAGTTGGGSGSGTTVTSCSAFKSAASSGGVIRISGTLSGCGIVDLAGGTSVIGVGANSGLTGGGIRIRQKSNVIIRNLRFRNPPEGGDSLALDEATNVWIDHNEFQNDGITGDKDYYDGQLDITHASDYVTVSWNTFADHWKGSLIGHSASNGGEDSGHLRVTYHHNWWNNVNSRTPSLRFGTGHIYSSCYENIPTSGLNIREGARALAENNYFSNVNQAIVTNVDADVEGYVTERNNIFVNSPTEITRTGHTNPPYSYTLDPASCICARVKSQAGTGIIS